MFKNPTQFKEKTFRNQLSSFFALNLYNYKDNLNNNNNNIFIQILKLHTVLFDIGNESNEHNYTANTLFTMF